MSSEPHDDVSRPELRARSRTDTPATAIAFVVMLFAVLHTWNQQLLFHPHVHCVVPAGGLSPHIAHMMYLCTTCSQWISMRSGTG